MKSKGAVRALSYYYVLSGKIKKFPCGVCGSALSEMHHPDYSNPLEVVWLCKKHHHEKHKQERRDAGHMKTSSVFQVTLNKALRKRANAHFRRRRKTTKSAFIREAVIFYLDHLDAEDRFLSKEGREA